MQRLVKIRGVRGRWVAEVEGQWLAVLHDAHRIGPDKHFAPFDRDMRAGKRGRDYLDALSASDLAVIQITDSATGGRKGYVGVFRFTDLVIDHERGMSCTFTEKYADPRT